MKKFGRLRLNTKFSLILLGVFLIGIGIGGYILSRSEERAAEKEVAQRGLLLLDTMNGVRAYTSQHITPLLRDEQALQEEFISETVPAFSARTIFENFRSYGYEDFIYKEATLDPTNPIDKADAFETDIVWQFQDDSDLTETTGFRIWRGQNTFYIARPIRIINADCLACHGDPAEASPAQVKKYGSEGGFGWQLNQVVGAQIVYVPADEVFDSAQASFLSVIAIFGVIFGVVILALNIVLRPAIVSPVLDLAELAEEVGEDRLTAESLENEKLTRVAQRADELGQLARTFQKMTLQVYRREQNLKQQVQELRVAINNPQTVEQVAVITETEYFQSLKQRAEDLRRRG